MEVSRSGYYYFLKKTQTKQVDKDFELLSQVRHIHKETRGTYGSRRMSKALEAAGYAVGRFRARRLMKKAGLEVNRPKRFKKTTDSRHKLPVAPNRVNQQFKVEQPDQIWCGDITYLWTQEGWLYLAVIIDLYSRKVVGLGSPVEDLVGSGGPPDGLLAPETTVGVDLSFRSGLSVCRR